MSHQDANGGLVARQYRLVKWGATLTARGIHHCAMLNQLSQGGGGTGGRGQRRQREAVPKAILKPSPIGRVDCGWQTGQVDVGRHPLLEQHADSLGVVGQHGGGDGRHAAE